MAPPREGHETPLEPFGRNASGSWAVISKNVVTENIRRPQEKLGKIM